MEKERGEEKGRAVAVTLMAALSPPSRSRGIRTLSLTLSLQSQQLSLSNIGSSTTPPGYRVLRVLGFTSFLFSLDTSLSFSPATTPFSLLLSFVAAAVTDCCSRASS